MYIKGHTPWNKGKKVISNTGRTWFKNGKNNPNYGKPNWNTGKKMSKESIEKTRLKNTGKIRSEEFKEKMRNTPNTGWIKKGQRLSPVTEFKKGQFVREKHPNWNNGSSGFPYPIEWTDRFKKEIRWRDGCVCQYCGEFGKYVHHIDYDKYNCNHDNLTTLCSSCHTLTNHKRKIWEMWFQIDIEIEKIINQQFQDLYL